MPSLILLSVAVVGMQNRVEAKTKTFYYIQAQEVNRVEVLKNFFTKYNSDLANNAETFVAVADRYNIDYKLMPAISCMESTCAKNIIKDSYNPFGWGIYGDKVTYFGSYDEAIQTVGEGLNKNYFAKGYNTAEKIAPIYTPPNHRNWLNGVEYFQGEIMELEKAQIEVTTNTGAL